LQKWTHIRQQLSIYVWPWQTHSIDVKVDRLARELFELVMHPIEMRVGGQEPIQSG